MYSINKNYLKLNGNYLFSDIARKVAKFSALHPECNIISLGIGDVTQPLVPAIIQALHKAVDEMGEASTFRGYAPEFGYEFLRRAIASQDYLKRHCDIHEDEIFISDGAKSDAGNIQELLGSDCRVAVCDPVYPVYVDTNVMAGRAGIFQPESKKWSNIIYMPCTRDTDFLPEFPIENPDVIYLCFPNNPTGAVMKRPILQAWVDYAKRIGALIIFDAAYEAYITEEQVPHTIFECDGARECAIELRTFSKNAGFTGLRLGAMVIPKALSCDGHSIHALWQRRYGTRYNGTSYVIQRAGEAVYSIDAKKQLEAQISYYQKNADLMSEHLKKAGYTVHGGKNAPYLWLQVPEGLSSWGFFNLLLEKANVVGTPGCGFGSSGEGYLRLSAFGKRDSILEAIRRIEKI